MASVGITLVMADSFDKTEGRLFERRVFKHFFFFQYFQGGDAACVAESYEYAMECLIIENVEECEDISLCKKTVTYNTFYCPQYRCTMNDADDSTSTLAPKISTTAVATTSLPFPQVSCFPLFIL